MKEIEVYCPNEKCGDPVPSFDGKVYFTKRRMSYAGRKIGVDRCPVCEKRRAFRHNAFSQGYIELKN